MRKLFIAAALLLSTTIATAANYVNVRGTQLVLGESRYSVINKLGLPDENQLAGKLMIYRFEGRNRLAIRLDMQGKINDIFVVDNIGPTYVDFNGFTVNLGKDDTMTAVKKLGNVCSEYDEDSFGIANYIIESRSGAHDEFAIQFRAQVQTKEGTGVLMKKPVEELWLFQGTPKTSTNCNYKP